MVASPAVVAGGGAAIVVVLVFAIVVRGRRRRARHRKHEAYLDDQRRVPAVEPLPDPVLLTEALLVDDGPPALPRRGDARLAESEPEPEPEPEAVMVCRADQLAVHVAELAAQTAALTDAVMDLVARGAMLSQPQTIVVTAPAAEPEPEPAPVPEPLAFAPIGAPVPEAFEPEREPELEPDPVRVAERDARVRELVLHPPVREAFGDDFDWPSENELRAFARSQPPRDDR